MERTKSDRAEITQSITLFDPGNSSDTNPCPEHSRVETTTQGARG